MLNSIGIFVTTKCNLFCVNCCFCIPYTSPIDYNVSNYIDSLLKLKNKGIEFNLIELLGGEVLLYSDLANFIGELKQTTKYKIGLTSNSTVALEEDYTKYNKVFEMLDGIYLSVYPQVFNTEDKLKLLDNFILYLENNHPHLVVNKQVTKYFYTHSFLDTPDEDRTCGLHIPYTLALGDNKKLYKCGLQLLLDNNAFDSNKTKDIPNFNIFKSMQNWNDISINVDDILDLNSLFKFSYIYNHQKNRFIGCKYHHWEFRKNSTLKNAFTNNFANNEAAGSDLWSKAKISSGYYNTLHECKLS